MLVSHFFPPMGGGGVQRVTKWVRYLDAFGWRATVIAGRPEDYWMRDESLLEELPDSTRVVRTQAASGLGLLRRVRGAGSGSKRSGSGFAWLRRAAAWTLIPDSYIGWRPFALRAARRVLAEDPPDVIVSSSPPETNHLVAQALQRHSGLPWVADFRDPWFGLHLRPAPTPLHRRRHARAERQVLAGASAIVATTLWLRDLLRARAPEGVPVVVIRNGYDPADFESLEPLPPPSPGPRPLHLLHAGMLTMTRSVNGLLAGLRRGLDHGDFAASDLQVTLLGARESQNEAPVAAMGLQQLVTFEDYVGHRAALQAMRAADVLVLLKHTDPRYHGLIPGKFYEYLGARRPLLALVPESEAADLVRRLECGWVAPPDDPEAIRRLLTDLVARHRAGDLEARVARGDLSAFERPEQARTFAALLDQQVARVAGGTR